MPSESAENIGYDELEEKLRVIAAHQAAIMAASEYLIRGLLRRIEALDAALKELAR